MQEILTQIADNLAAQSVRLDTISERLDDLGNRLDAIHDTLAAAGSTPQQVRRAA